MNKNFGIISNTVDKLTKPFKPITNTVKTAVNTVKKINNKVQSVKSAMDKFIASQNDKAFSVSTSGAIDFNQDNVNEDIDMNANFSKSGTQRDIDQNNLFKSILYTAKFMAESKNLNGWKDFIPVYQKMFEQIDANMDPEAWIDATGIPYIKNYCKEAKLSSTVEKMWIDAFSGLMMGVLKMK